MTTEHTTNWPEQQSLFSHHRRTFPPADKSLVSVTVLNVATDPSQLLIQVREQ